MFGRMMNNFYYGKSGKGDFRKEDLPKNRWQLFWEMLRVRFSGLCRLNLMTVAAWLPLIIVMALFIINVINVLNNQLQFQEYLENGTLTETFTEDTVKRLAEAKITDMETMAVASFDVLKIELIKLFLLFIPCILITGPVQAGLAYVTRNWSRDEHAFIWSDFKDAVKENWKQALGVSAITSVLPIILYVGYQFYGQQAQNNVIFMVPQMLLVMICVVWALSLVFMYPMMVTYKVTFGQLIKNSMVMAIGRLPQTAGIRLLMLLPTLIAGVAFFFTGSPIALLVLGAYYIIIGFAFFRFVCASYTNGVFDKFINSHMEGVQINRGLASEEDEEEEEEEQQEDQNQPQ